MISTIKDLTEKHSKNLRNAIGDASFIGLDCPSGNVDDCNDGTEESVQDECAGILIVPEKQSQCGSKCSVDEIVTRSGKYQANATETANFTSTANFTKSWTFYTSKAFKTLFFVIQTYYTQYSHFELIKALTQSMERETMKTFLLPIRKKWKS